MASKQILRGLLDQERAKIAAFRKILPSMLGGQRALAETVGQLLVLVEADLEGSEHEDETRRYVESVREWLVLGKVAEGSVLTMIDALTEDEEAWQMVRRALLGEEPDDG